MQALMDIAEMILPYWGLVLMMLFLAVVAWAFWPSASRKKAMDDHANIPFREDTEAP